MEKNVLIWLNKKMIILKVMFSVIRFILIGGHDEKIKTTLFTRKGILSLEEFCIFNVLWKNWLTNYLQNFVNLLQKAPGATVVYRMH